MVQKIPVLTLSRSYNFQETIFEVRGKDLDLYGTLNSSELVNGAQLIGKESAGNDNTSSTYPTERYTAVTKSDVFRQYCMVKSNVA